MGANVLLHHGLTRRRIRQVGGDQKAFPACLFDELLRLLSTVVLIRIQLFPPTLSPRCGGGGGATHSDSSTGR
jgi:hypothetical protein